MTSYLDTGANSGGAWAVQAWDRGNWVDVSQDPSTGFVTIGAPHVKRTPWYTQTDFSISQNFKITESKIAKLLRGNDQPVESTGGHCISHRHHLAG